MTTEELLTILKAKIRQAYTNQTTRKQYVGAVTRVLNRVPMEFFGDETVMRLYRQLLSPATKSIFGVIWKKIHEELLLRDIPCVDPDNLIYRIRTPMIAGWPLERLAITTSTAAMATTMWTDVHVDEGTIYLRGIPLDKAEEHALEVVAAYFWPGEVPPPTAPIIPMSRNARLVFMPPEMVEDAINDRYADRKRELEDMAYAAYDELYEAGYTLKEIEERMEAIETLPKMSRHYRAKAEATLTGAVRILKVSRDRETFNRVWKMGIEGREMYVQDAVKMAPPSSTPPPPKAAAVNVYRSDWQMTLNLAG